MTLVLVAILDRNTGEHYLAVTDADNQESLFISKHPDAKATEDAAMQIIAMNDDAWDAKEIAVPTGEPQA